MSIESGGVQAGRPTPQSAQSLPLERSDRAAAGAARGSPSSAGRPGGLRNYAVQRRIAAGLGWLSIGLGLFELIAPRTLSRLVGIEKREPRGSLWLTDRTSSWALPLILRGLGVREVLSGVAILTRPRPAAWLWSRVVGDAMDLSLLGLALSSRRNDRIRLSGATVAVLGITALDVLSSLELTRVGRRTRRSWSIIGLGVPALRERLRPGAKAE